MVMTMTITTILTRMIAAVATTMTMMITMAQRRRMFLEAEKWDATAEVIRFHLQ